MCVHAERELEIGQRHEKRKRDCEKADEVRKTFLFFFTFFAPIFDDKARQIEKPKPRFSSITLSFFPAFRPLERRTRFSVVPSARLQKKNSSKKTALSEKHRSIRTMADANDTLELIAAPADDDAPLTINDLPNDVLVSISDQSAQTFAFTKSKNENRTQPLNLSTQLSRLFLEKHHHLGVGLETALLRGHPRRHLHSSQLARCVPRD